MNAHRISDFGRESGLLSKDTIENLEEFTWWKATSTNSSGTFPTLQKEHLSTFL